ncbi:TIGR00268 family protein [Sulfodiicoccus acidiphilus]|uniref:TIGR00268 family protein n=1 Tax=Sulfodiicoccus acidiphilus TaxID=1670455 RepID=A0A348B6F4_9CREN|nr:ATP-dependent sacrificial sulfur transferase LarE [Sulfodiicoccus acidiphilus]BBD73756.1 TIGR00268 family protein [Sulfodiicoccus acidiphilus]GGT98111.1 TIGR00268 family protein [Sulfodiicoccus acidiphilus]
MESDVNSKLDELLKWFERNCQGRAIVALSGGVDSSLVVYGASKTLGRERVLAVTTKSQINLDEDLLWAERVASSVGVEHVVIETDELKYENFRSNPPNRCYFCKDNLYSIMVKIKGPTDTLLDGLNASDLRVHRPGFLAKRKYQVRSPLAEVGLTKEDVRGLAKVLGLPNWDRPSESCLASRVPYGEEVTREKLARIREAEVAVKELSNVSVVRVRSHGELARIEVPKEEMFKLFERDTFSKVADRLEGLGFTYVTIDLRGYRSGSLDLVLRRKVIPLEGDRTSQHLI